MEQLNKKTKFKKAGAPVISSKLKGLIFIVLIGMLGISCKKTEVNNTDRDYGYAKVIVECENKCHVAFGTPDKDNVYDVEKEAATYYIRYQRNYNLDIDITPLNADQNVTLSVYSREEKQIFRNKALKKVNEVWNSKIVIP